MKNVIIALIIVAALPLATLPAAAGEITFTESTSNQGTSKKRSVITKGTRLSDTEMSEYKVVAQNSRLHVSRDAGGEGSNIGPIILWTSVVVGIAVIAAVSYSNALGGKVPPPQPAF